VFVFAARRRGESHTGRLRVHSFAVSGESDNPTSTGGRTAFVWADPVQASWLRSAMDRAGIAIIGAGSPEAGRGPELIAALGGDRDSVPLSDDLRSVLTSASTDLVLIAAPGDFAGGQRQGGMDREDAAALAACRSRGVVVATLEPMPCSALQLGITLDPALGEHAAVNAGAEVIGAPVGAGVMLGQGAPVRAAESREVAPRARHAADSGGGWARMVPLLRHCRAMREAADVLEQFGHVRTVAMECWCGAGQGTLGSRIVDALDCVIALFGVPEQVHASYVWPVRGRALHPAAGDTLRGLSGDLTANLRFADGRTASVAISDRAARWSRAVTLIGEGGRLHITDDGAAGTGTGTGGFTWLSADGATVDTSRPARRKRSAEERADEAMVDAVAEQLSRMLDSRLPAPPPTDAAGVLGAAGAALLSARTGEAESPQTILRMVGAR